MHYLGYKGRCERSQPGNQRLLTSSTGFYCLLKGEKALIFWQCFLNVWRMMLALGNIILTCQDVLYELGPFPYMC